MEIVAANPVLAVHDLQASAEWYRQVLACEAAEVDPGNWVFCRSGSIQFMLGRCPDTPPASEIGDHSYVAYLEVDDIQAYYARAKGAGAEVSKELRREPWGREEFGIRSPDGHRFMVAGRNPPQ